MFVLIEYYSIHMYKNVTMDTNSINNVQFYKAVKLQLKLTMLKTNKNICINDCFDCFLKFVVKSKRQVKVKKTTSISL